MDEHEEEYKVHIKHVNTYLQTVYADKFQKIAMVWTSKLFLWRKYNIILNWYFIYYYSRTCKELKFLECTKWKWVSRDLWMFLRICHNNQPLNIPIFLIKLVLLIRRRKLKTLVLSWSMSNIVASFFLACTNEKWRVLNKDDEILFEPYEVPFLYIVIYSVTYCYFKERTTKSKKRMENYNGHTNQQYSFHPGRGSKS